MPRKAAAPVDESVEASEPRRSSRIKDQPKPEPVEKKPTKPRAKKADKEVKEDGAEKPKSSRGKKRKAEDAPADEAPVGDDTEKPPPSKKVRHHSLMLRASGFERDMILISHCSLCSF
jgi:hypothetical protein